MNIRRVLVSLTITILAVSTVTGLSSAFFSDTEISEGNVLSAGSIDLLLNGENNTEAIVNFTDLKPGDIIIEPKTLRVNTNDAYVWMHITDVVTAQGTDTAPELEEEDGTPKHDINNYLGYDLEVVDGDVIIPADSPTPFNDIVSCWIPLGILPGDTNVVVNQSYHFPESITNWAQGDELTFTEEFYAVQVRNNEGATPPARDRVWNPETLRCEDVVEDPLLWIIGDEEADILDNPVDEFNFESLGNLPNPPNPGEVVERTITAQVDNVADQVFPWNSSFNANYARTIEITFDVNFTGNALLTLRWSPGRSSTENKAVYLNNIFQDTIGPISGFADSNYWSSYPMREDTVELSLTPGTHVIRLEHTSGDGTVWDFIKLERI